METVGRYQVLHKLGAGGMAEVLLGRTTGEGGFEKLVAIKRILPSMAENESFVKMFIDEATISAKLNHSSIGQIFEFGKAGDSYFIAMEYIQGVDLRSIHRVFRKQKIAPIPELGAYIMMHVCSALEYAHSKTDTNGQPLNIIHRDLSPSNVLVSFEGEVKLIDFGIAKAAQRLYVTVGANLKGKYAYMSPEQAFGKPVDHRSDIFGAGTLLFELLTGRNPFRADTDLSTLQRVQAARVPEPSRVVKGVDAELDRITLHALTQSPDTRYQTAGEMQEDLEVFSKRSAFSSRRMALWMKEAFREQIEKSRQMLIKAREKAEAEGGLQVISTDELRQIHQIPAPTPQPTPQSTQPQPSLQPSVQQPTPQPPTPQTTPHPVVPTDPGAPYHVDMTPNPVDPSPFGQATGPPPPNSMRPDPSSSHMAMEMSRGNSGLAVVPPDTSRPLRRRSNMGSHVVIFTLIVILAGVGLYFAFGKKIFKPAPPPSPTGGVTVSLEPPFPAEVYVDDAMRGTVATGRELTISRLLAGKHRLRVQGDLILPAEKIVEIVKGHTIKVQLKVQPKVSEGPGGEGEEEKGTRK